VQELVLSANFLTRQWLQILQSFKAAATATAKKTHLLLVGQGIQPLRQPLCCIAALLVANDWASPQGQEECRQALHQAVYTLKPVGSNSGGGSGSGITRGCGSACFDVCLH
jgi:hypothetical protein